VPGKPHRPRASILTTVRDKHTQGNRRAKDDWSLYATHRAHLTAAITSLAPPSAAPLVLLGAGNCNDVDLAALAPHFSTIHLVDIDASALDRARARLSPDLRPRVHAHGGVDLTGLLTTLDGAAPTPTSTPVGESTIAAAIAAITAAVPVRDAAVVVSCCLLSQLGWSLEEASDGDESRGMELRMVALAIHLRTMVALARPGAAVLIAADITSSELYPLDDLDPTDAASPSPLATLATQLISAQTQIFAAANPVLLNRVLRRDPLCRSALVDPRTLPPWLWTGPFDRVYLVYPQVWRISTKP
jgi:hypothetical protein